MIEVVAVVEAVAKERRRTVAGMAVATAATARVVARVSRRLCRRAVRVGVKECGGRLLIADCGRFVGKQRSDAR